MSEDILNHDEIRLLILSRLYQKYYQGGTFTYFQTTEIFSDLLEKQPQAITGDLVYLEQKKMIGVLRGVNERLPNSVMITSEGIDQYETAMKKAYEKLIDSDTVIPEDMKSDLNAGIFDKVDEWLDNHPAIVRIFSKLFVGSLKGDLESIDD